MNRPNLPAKRSLRPHTAPTGDDLKALLLPIVKRLPAYLKLGWALAREPAIARRHKTLLYSTVIYTVTPVHLVFSPIPVVGQIDSFVLLLLGIRQAYNHCPSVLRARYLARLKLAPTQLEQDLRVLLFVAWHAFGKVSRPIGRQLRFAGRVASGFSSRTVKRLLAPQTANR